MANDKPEKSIDDGGPAFPCYHEDTGEIAEGMSLRTWLAGQALAAIIGNDEVERESSSRSAIARDALEYADALIAESTQ